jgi:hypothetical protein
MDVVNLITVIGSFLTLLGAIVGLFIYLANKMDRIREEITSWKTEVHNEMKDFHGRLCSIEEKNRK